MKIPDPEKSKVQKIRHKTFEVIFMKHTYEKKFHCLNLVKVGCSMHIPADTRSAFPVISVQLPVSIQCCWQS